MIGSSAKRSNDAERAARYRARKKEAAKSVLARDEASSGSASHQMQMELEDSKRQNDRLQKMLDDLQHQMHLLNAALIANAGMGVPQSGPVNRMPAPPPAEPVPVAMPRAPSFAAPVFDAQLEMINRRHPGAGR